MKIPIFFTFFLLSTYAFSNDFTGVWKGTSTDYKYPLELTLYIKQLDNGMYTGIAIQTAKGAWTQKNLASVTIFDKKQTVKKKIFGYADANNHIKLQEIAIYEKDNKNDWTLDTYSFALSQENGKTFLKSPILKIGDYDMKLVLSLQNISVTPEMEQQLITTNPFTITNISYTSKTLGKAIFKYNDSARLVFNINIQTNISNPINTACLLQADSRSKIFENNQTNKILKQEVELAPAQSLLIDFPIHTSYFDNLDSINFKVVLFKTFGQTVDTFFFSVSQVTIPVENFFIKNPTSAGNITGERIKAIGYIFGMQKGDPSAGIKALDNLILKKDAKAKMWRAICYENGIGGSEGNINKATDFAIHAFNEVETMARYNDAEAMYLLFNAYQLLDKSDNEKRFGLTLLAKSADQDFALAAYDLSRVFFIQKNYHEANKYAQIAYNKGVNSAAVILGQSYENGLDVKKDIHEAQDWYQKGIIAGNPDAMMCMALLYNKGKDVTPDIVKAVALAKQAAVKNNTSAMLFLGNVYLKGNQGIGADGSSALEWFKKAADLNNRNGMLSLGLLYEKGSDIGVVKDDKSAFYWIQKAAVAGEPDAMKVLSTFCREGTGIDKDIIASRFWYQEGESNQPSSNNLSAKTSNLQDLKNFWDFADFSPTYYEDVYTGEVYSNGPDIMDGFISGIIGSYLESRSQVQELINDIELMYDEKDKKVYGGTVSSSFKSEIKFNKGQELKISCNGSMKLGFMLSGISPNGTQGYQNYSIDPQIPHGAFIIRINNGKWLYVGRNLELTVPEDCYLQIAVNDNDYTNNVGYYDFKIIAK